MSELEPRRTGAAAPADGDNRYKSVQRKLKTLRHAMDEAEVELGGLLRSMRANATHTEELAGHIAHAELDRKFVELTNQWPWPWAAPPSRSARCTQPRRKSPPWPTTRSTRTRGCTRAWTTSAPAVRSAPPSRALRPLTLSPTPRWAARHAGGRPTRS